LAHTLQKRQFDLSLDRQNLLQATEVITSAIPTLLPHLVQLQIHARVIDDRPIETIRATENEILNNSITDETP